MIAEVADVVGGATGAARAAAGFTLIEAAVVAGLAAILAAVALPIYNTYVVRGCVHAAQAAMLAQAASFGQYALDHRKYPKACVSPQALTAFSLSCRSDNTASPPTYTITATGSGAAAGFAFTLDASGAKNTVAVPPGWTLTRNCWVSSAAGDCAFP